MLPGNLPTIENKQPMKAIEIDGWMSDDELDWLRSNRKGCKRILEIGSWKGRSSGCSSRQSRSQPLTAGVVIGH